LIVTLFVTAKIRQLSENRNRLQQTTRKQNTVIHDNSNWLIRRRAWLTVPTWCRKHGEIYTFPIFEYFETDYLHSATEMGFILHTVN